LLVSSFKKPEHLAKYPTAHLSDFNSVEAVRERSEQFKAFYFGAAAQDDARQLQDTVRALLCMVSSTAVVEQSLSVAGRMDSERRTRMQPALLNALTVTNNYIKRNNVDIDRLVTSLITKDENVNKKTRV
jgi:hypothetical protein